MNTNLFCFALLAGSFVFAAQASAQTFNVDIDGVPSLPGGGVPASTFAAAGQAGTWNSVSATTLSTALVDVNGAATAVTIGNTLVPGFAFAFDNQATTGDDQALLDDAQDPSQHAQWTISGLLPGDYTVYTYAWAPDNITFLTNVSVNLGPTTSVGGPFAGSYVIGVTHARDNVVVAQGGTIVVDLTVGNGFATFNGLQLVRIGPPVQGAYCFGDGSGTICPCSNAGAPGNGCANSSQAAGANLATNGVASIAADTLVLSGSGMPATSTCLYMQGTSQASSIFGDGLNCVGGMQIRLGTKTNSGGASTYPGPGQPSVSVRGGASVGSALNYQVAYRDAPSFCTTATFNLTNGMHVVWAP